MKPKRFLVGLVALAAVLLCGSAAEAERRVAFVIGNSAYKNATSLPNTINDATAIAALFRSVGFEVVTSRTDLGVVDFKRAVRDFRITAETADIAVVYYAGHGIEVAGTNYLIPVDAKLARDYDVEDEAVALDRIIWALQSVKRLRLILLDACRDNPFVTKLQRSVGVRAAAKGGLGKLDDVSADTLVAYAARAGSVSYDGDGANSPFATALLKHIAEPGVDIRIRGPAGTVHLRLPRRCDHSAGAAAAGKKDRARAGAAACGGRAGARDPAGRRGRAGRAQSGRQAGTDDRQCAAD